MEKSFFHQDLQRKLIAFFTHLLFCNFRRFSGWEKEGETWYRINFFFHNIRCSLEFVNIFLRSNDFQVLIFSAQIGRMMMVAMVAVKAYVALTGRCSQHFTKINSFFPHNKPMRYVPLSPFYRWGRRDQRGYNLPQVTQLVNGSIRIQPRYLYPESIFLPTMFYNRCCLHWLLTSGERNFLDNRSMLWFKDKSHRRIPHSNKLTSQDLMKMNEVIMLASISLQVPWL